VIINARFLQSLQSVNANHWTYWKWTWFRIPVFYLIASIKARTSCTLHAVVLGPNLTGCGYFPDFTPSHQDDFPTGNICRIVGRRTNPVSGKTFDVIILLLPFRKLLLEPLSSVSLTFGSGRFPAILNDFFKLRFPDHCPLTDLSPS